MEGRPVRQPAVMIAALTALLCFRACAHAWEPGEDLVALGLPRFVVKELDHPERPATRYEMAFLFVEIFRLEEVVEHQTGAQRAAMVSAHGSGAPFHPQAVLKPTPYPDVPPEHWAADAVETWRRWRRLRPEGFGEDPFKGRRPVRRREFAGYLHNLVSRLHSEYPTIPWRPVERAPEPFADAIPGEWPWMFTEDLRRWGVLHGHADGTFRGKELLTRGELQACLERAVQLFGKQ